MDVAFRPMGIHSEEDIILALDPGRDKTGFAFVDSDGNLLASGIFASSERDNFFRTLDSDKNFSEWTLEGSSKNIAHSRVRLIALGNGTGSEEFHDYVKSAVHVHYDIMIVNERNTTLEARSLYWKIHKPGLLTKLIPEGLRVPDRILDDLAAWAIALRALRALSEKI